ncbi:hypothetical protein KFK09_025159 [Dendrobium nobile]|uniref:Uncharacterized protein n=1 Tax=Dendrobium nobile TaxID=94219 RepID=A0A8T3AGY5_DENNO|nr:hypothetical protein KFK09_025159 [Dendrobium nobile]
MLQWWCLLSLFNLSTRIEVWECRNALLSISCLTRSTMMLRFRVPLCSTHHLPPTTQYNVTILRYNFALNRWLKESSLRRKLPSEDSCGFVAMNGELCVLTKAIPLIDPSEPGKVFRKRITLEIQAYDPQRKKWRFFTTNPPFHHPIDFKTAVSCSIQL